MKKSKNKTLSTLSTIIAGLIIISVANYGGKIITYFNGGFKYGYRVFTPALLLFISFIAIQEMNIRMAKVTGKSLADLIREWYGVKPAFFAMSILLISSVLLSISNFSAFAIGASLIGINKYIAVPVIAILIWLMVIKRHYKSAQSIFFILSIMFVVYIISVIDINGANKGTRIFFQHNDIWQGEYIYYFLSMIGSSLPICMMFHLQAYLVDEDLNLKEYKEEKIGIYVGLIIMFLISLVIIMLGAQSLQRIGEIFISNRSLGEVLVNTFGKYARYIFGAGILSFTIMSLVVIPLSTTLAICDAFALENEFEQGYKEAPLFYIIFTFIIIISGIFVLACRGPLMNLIFLAQVLSSIFIPIILIYMIIIANNSEIMDKEVNRPIVNIIVWLTVIGIVVLFISLAIFKLVAVF